MLKILWGLVICLTIAAMVPRSCCIYSSGKCYWNAQTPMVPNIRYSSCIMIKCVLAIVEAYVFLCLHKNSWWTAHQLWFVCTFISMFHKCNIFLNIDSFPEEIGFNGITGDAKKLPEHGKQLFTLTQSHSARMMQFNIWILGAII